MGERNDPARLAHWSRRRFLQQAGAGAAAGVAGIAVPLSAGPGRADAAGTPTCGSFSLQSAVVSGGELTAAGFVSAGEWWAVGNSGSALHSNQTLIERFDGSGWSVVTSPNQGTSNNALNDVSMIPGGGWAVGYYQASGIFEPLALNWDGTQWSVDSPAGFPGNALFTGVHTMADGSAWAVGFQTAATGTRQTLVEHASGGAWTQVASPNDGTASSDNTLMAVAGTAVAGLWAVGYQLTPPAGLAPLVLRYDTSLSSPSWVSVSGAGGVPSPGAVETVLTGVDVRSASNVWAVGYYDNGGGKQPLALHWNGKRWSNSPVPGAGLLRTVKVAGTGNVWAAGAYYNAALQRYQTLVVHYDGTSWSTVVSADGHSESEIIGMAADPVGSTITLVGRTGPNPLIEQASCPAGPVSPPTRAPAPVLSVPPAPGVGPAPGPPPKTPPPKTPVPVTIADQSAAAGIAGPSDWSFSAAVADFNNDGWPDLFVTHHWHPAQLWLNNHDGTFSQADKAFFSDITDRHDCQPADFNQDGRMDMFCSVGADRGTAVKSNALYIQQPDGTFVDQGYQWGVSDPTGRGRWCAVLDVNNDGYPDIFYGAEPLRPDGLPSINRLYLNTGHGSFIDSPAMGLNLNIGSLSARAVDYNNNGWPDLLVCGKPPFGLHLFRNDQGQGFTDVTPVLGEPVQAQDAVMVDVNHDNLPDLITLTTNKVAVHLQNADGTFAPPKTILTVKNGVSLAVGDVNGDNNPDIYVVCGRTGSENEPDFLLLGDATGGFTTMPIPVTTAGNGEAAYPIDYNRSGLTSFLVLNGEVPYSGPVQLLTPKAS